MNKHRLGPHDYLERAKSLREYGISPMNVLVTGCAGFIGARVSALLGERGHNVVGVDNMNDGYDVRLKNWRFEQLRRQPRFIFHQLDITNRGELVALFQDHRIDVVVNLAARAGVRQSIRNPWIYYETNVTGALNLLETCRSCKIPKFVQASSSSLYGLAARPFQEDQSTDYPLSPYAASKKAAETLCYTYHQLYGLDITVLRYFTVYGPAGRPDMSVFRFIRHIAEGDPLLLYGDGSQERDYTYVDDIAEGTLSALRPIGFEIINLGSDRPVAVRQVISYLEEILRKSARLEHLPPHPADVAATWANITKARRILEWTPKTSLEVGLQHAIEWYQANRSWAALLDLGD